MIAWKAIQNTIERIEENLDQKLVIEELADAAGLSYYYYQRLFQRLVGKPVQEYIRLRRLARAAGLIQKTPLTLAAIALECGFQDQSQLSRAFKGCYGLTPGQVRRQKPVLDVQQKPDLALRYEAMPEMMPLITDGMVLDIERQTLHQDVIYYGKSTEAEIRTMHEPKVNLLEPLWDSVKDDLETPAADVLTLTENPALFNYFVGTEKVSETAEQRCMPKGEYIVCRYNAESFEELVSTALAKASGFVFERWLPAHHLLPEPFLVQKYFNPKSDKAYIELWVKINPEAIQEG